jgi:hypothetical protein
MTYVGSVRKVDLRPDRHNLIEYTRKVDLRPDRHNLSENTISGQPITRQPLAVCYGDMYSNPVLGHGGVMSAYVITENLGTIK